MENILSCIDAADMYIDDAGFFFSSWQHYLDIHVFMHHKI